MQIYFFFKHLSKLLDTPWMTVIYVSPIQGVSYKGKKQFYLSFIFISFLYDIMNL